jgi:LuxR family maltose regulon positive regulatory protein
MEEKKLDDQLLVTIVLQALALHAQGENESARQALKESLTLAEPGGFIRLFVDAGEPMRLLLQGLRSWIDQHPKEQDLRLIAYMEKILSAFASSVEVQVSKSKSSCKVIAMISFRFGSSSTISASGFAMFLSHNLHWK